MQNGSFLPTFRDNLSVPSSRINLDCSTLEDGWIGCPETSVINCHSTLRKIRKKQVVNNNVLKAVINSKTWIYKRNVFVMNFRTAWFNRSGVTDSLQSVLCSWDRASWYIKII